MRVRELSIKDMQRGGRGHRWRHDRIQSFLRNVYERKGDGVVIGLSLDDIDRRWYEGRLSDLRCDRRTAAKILKKDLRKEGFSLRSISPYYSSAVSVERDTLRLELRKKR